MISGTLVARPNTMSVVLIASACARSTRAAAVSAAAGAVFVVALGYGLRKMKGQEPLDAPLVVDSPGPDDFPHRTKH